MNIFQLLENLCCNKHSKWLIDLDIKENNIQPYVVQRWLAMNDSLRVQTRWLDKYVFGLQSNPKMYLSLAWSVIPKSQKMPFFKYIKKDESEYKFDFILNDLKDTYKISDNDWKPLYPRLKKDIEKNTVDWFIAFGVPKKDWIKYGVNSKEVKKEIKTIKKQKGLSAFIGG